MKKILLLLILFSLKTFSQEIIAEDVYASDVIEPKFNGGGIDKFFDYIEKEFNFSKVTSKGRMIFSFTISTTGEVTNIRIVQFVDMEAAKEIIRVLKQAPKWECARRAGKPFAVDVKFPLDFE